MRIALFVPDGIGIRNYLYSDLLEQLQGHDLYLLHHLPDPVLEEIMRLHPQTIPAIKMPELPEDRFNDTLRKVCMYGRLHLQARIAGNSSIKKNWLFFSLIKGRQKWLYRMIDLLGAMVAISPSILLSAENWLYKRMMRSASGKTATTLLQDIQPDIILCTHQRSVEAGYLMTAARQMHIATATVIFSWDNLPKSRINFLADQYLVWSNWMKKDLLRFYKHIKEEQVVITGTPQFGFYSDPSLTWSRQQLDAHFKVPANKRLVCFSGNEPSFPSDHFYLQDLLEDLQELQNKGQEIPFIIVRPSPADHTNRFRNIVERFPELALLALPEWKQFGAREWTSFYPLFSDTIILTNLVQHCDAVINVGSTMGLDFAHTNKPALYIRYNHPACTWFDLKYGYEQEHFKSLEGLDAVVWINSRMEFATTLLKVIDTPGDFATDRLKWKQRITDDISTPTSRIAKSLIFTRQAAAQE